MIFDSYFRNLLSTNEVGLSIDSNFRIAFGIIVVTHIVNHPPEEKKNSETSFPRVNEDRRDLIVAARDPIKGN